MNKIYVNKEIIYSFLNQLQKNLETSVFCCLHKKRVFKLHKHCIFLNETKIIILFKHCTYFSLLFI